MGALGFLFNFMIGIGVISIDAELPICGVQGVVERNDKLYVGLGFYNRVQIYDLNGNYSGYKETNNYSKDFYFTVDTNGNPKIEVAYNKDALKNLLKSNCLGTGCISYKIERQVPFRMVCYGTNNKNIVVQQSFFKSLWSGPLNPWLIAALGVIIFCLTNIFQICQLFAQNSDKQDKLKIFLQEVFK